MKNTAITKIVSLLERKANFIKTILRRKDRHLMVYGLMVLNTNGSPITCGSSTVSS